MCKLIEKYHIDVVHRDPSMKSVSQACCLNALGDVRKRNIDRKGNEVKYFTSYIFFHLSWKIKSLYSEVKLNKDFEVYCDKRISFPLYL